MQRILESKNIFRSYAHATKKYIESSKKMTAKSCKVLMQEIRVPSEEAIFKMKMLTTIISFFTQFFPPSKKSIMGMISKLDHKDITNKKNCGSPRLLSQENLIITLMESPKELLEIIHSLPNKLYNRNLLS